MSVLAELLSAQFYVDLVRIMTIDILLSGDNAVVIALASRSLPDAQRRTAIVVEVLGGQRLAVGREAGNHVARKVGGLQPRRRGSPGEHTHGYTVSVLVRLENPQAATR